MTSPGRARALIAAAGLAVLTVITAAGIDHAAESVRRSDAIAEAIAPATGPITAPAPRHAPPTHLAAARASVATTVDLDARRERTAPAADAMGASTLATSLPLRSTPVSPWQARAPPAKTVF